RDPERAELTLLLTAVAIGVVERVERGLAGRADELVLRCAASLGGVQELLVLLVGGDPSLNPCHDYSLLPYEVRQHLADQPAVAARTGAGAAAVAGFGAAAGAGFGAAAAAAGAGLGAAAVAAGAGAAGAGAAGAGAVVGAGVCGTGAPCASRRTGFMTMIIER